MDSRRQLLHRVMTGLAALLGGAAARAAAQPAPVEGRKTFTMTARRYEFVPEVLDVRRNDVVHLTITSEDIAHSFTVDAYRIQKRIPPGGTTAFEFRADEAGRFAFYCSMRAESGCAEMRGELIVR